MSMRMLHIVTSAALRGEKPIRIRTLSTPRVGSRLNERPPNKDGYEVRALLVTEGGAPSPSIQDEEIGAWRDLRKCVFSMRELASVPAPVLAVPVDTVERKENGSTKLSCRKGLRRSFIRETSDHGWLCSKRQTACCRTCSNTQTVL
jgi:hypothetical protein